jgi:hypothetical protein
MYVHVFLRKISCKRFGIDKYIRRFFRWKFSNPFTFFGILESVGKNCRQQGRREGVKGVTVSRGPDLKKGPGNHENKRKNRIYSLILGPKSTGF